MFLVLPLGAYLESLTVGGLDPGDGDELADVDAFARVLRATIGAALHGTGCCGKIFS